MHNLFKPGWKGEGVCSHMTDGGWRGTKIGPHLFLAVTQVIWNVQWHWPWLCWTSKEWFWLGRMSHIIIYVWHYWPLKNSCNFYQKHVINNNNNKEPYILWTSANVDSVVALCFLCELPSPPPDVPNGSTAAWGLSAGDLDFAGFSGVPLEDFFSLFLSDLEPLRERDLPSWLSLVCSRATSAAGDVCEGVDDLVTGVDELSLFSEPDPASLCKSTR